MELKSSNTEYISGKDAGAGIRLLYGNEELYTYSNALDEKSLLEAVKSLTALRRPPPDKKSLLNVEPFVSSFVQKFPHELKINLEKRKIFFTEIG